MRRDFRRSWSHLLGYEILFKILAAAVFSPLTAGLLAALIWSTGRVAVSNDQIVSFLLSPAGIAGLVLMAAAALVVLFAEQAGLVVIAAGGLRDHDVGTVRALRQVVRRLPRLLKLALVQAAVYLGCLLPFAAAAGATYALLLSEHNINYYLAETPPAFWLAVAIGAVCAAGLVAVWAVLYVRWIFAVPACILSGEPAVASLKGSGRLVKGDARRIAVALLAWLLAVGALGAVVAVVLRLGGGLLIALAGESLGVLVPTIAGLVTLNVLAAAVVSFVGVTTKGLLVTRLYFMESARTGRPLPEPAPQPAPPAAVWLSGKRAVFAGALALLVGTAIVSGVVLEAVDAEDRVAVTAHRGSSRGAPENSLSAVRLAIEQGADFAEIDVQETADGAIVVLHDDDLMRVAGLGKKIWEVDYDELRRLDAGSWFSPKFRGERIPALEEMIDLAAGRIKLNIELKYNGHDQQLARRVVDIIARKQFRSQCVVTSLNLDGVMEARRLDPELAVGFIVFRAIGDPAALEVDFLSVNTDYATRELIDAAHRHGKPVHVWTVNDPGTASSLIDRGADNLITDDPVMVRGIVDQRAKLSNTEKLLLRFSPTRAR